jgi:molybdate/tungstate transport system substrate-binding protein
MWQIATSMVSRTLTIGLVVVLLMAGAGFAGYEVGIRVPGGGGAAAASSTLSIVAAGSLNAPLFPTLADLLANETPGVSAPSAAQQYEGSLAVVNGIAQEGVVADVAAVADFRLIPGVLEPKYAAFEVVFASTSEVLAYDPAIAAFDGVNTTNWAYDLENATSGPGAVPFGVWNASTDPNGYNEIFALELQGALFGGGLSTFYAPFYSGAVGAFAVPNPSTTRTELESQASTLVSTGVVCAVITYRSYAVAHHMAFVRFDPIVGLESTTARALANYANVSTVVLNAQGGESTVHAAPILFAATVPSDATNATLGALFVHLLLSPQGGAVLSAGGAFDPVVPGWIDRPASAPPLLAPDVVPLPAWTGAFLT